ncbi:MAG: AI-2E family transporter [Thermoleophilia bacterium]
MQITIPRWAQLFVVPLAVILAVYFARMVSHALFVFLMATLLALLLNPVARAFLRARIPRAVSIPLVYLTLLSVVGVLFAVAVPPVARQAQALFERVPDWAAMFNRELPSYQSFLERYGIYVDLTGVVARSTEWLGGAGLSSVGRLFNLGVGVAGSLASLLLVLIVSFYMLIDGRRIVGALVRFFPVQDAVAEVYLEGLQTSFTRFIKGQALLATSVGLSAGIGVWVLGWDVVGVWPEGAQYALLFGVWAGLTEVIPYVGPWLGALPPVILALFHSPVTALWVAVIFWLIQLLENHILVPNIMGASVGVHPLMVIFALLAGAEVGGILGMLVVLPLLAMARHTLDFFDLRFSHAPWIGDDGVTPVELPAQPLPAQPLPAPAAAGTPGSESAPAASAGPTVTPTPESW